MSSQLDPFPSDSGSAPAGAGGAESSGLEARIAAMSEWTAPPPELWRAAMAGSGSRFSISRALAGPWAKVAAFAAAACVLFAAIGIIGIIGSPGVASRRASVSLSAPRPETDKNAGSYYKYGLADRDDRAMTGGRVDQPLPPPDAERASVRLANIEAPAQPARLVVRRAQVDLRARDVRATFVKVQFLVSEAKGEFVEDSTISGDGKTAQASVVLRVAADRLSEVLSEIRALGIATAESIKGEDVTDQVVDIEARLRNEQRIEKELLELVDSRKDAQLKDVMEVRTELSRVREEIEKLVAQRDRLGRMVSLATVLVVISSEEAGITPVDPKQSLGSQFVERLTRAWEGGLRGLSGSIAWIVETLIAGAVWWILLGAAVLVIILVRRRARRRAAREPAPAL